MASGNTLCVFTPAGNQPPASTYATYNTRNSHLVLEFDAATNWSAVFAGVLPRHYTSGGITVTIIWMAASATSGNCVWNAAFERDDTALDLDADSFATAQATTAAAPGTSGFPAYTTITFTNAQIDGLLAGEAFRLKLTRDAANVSDTMTGNAQVLRVELRET